jgi:hypothetical protein
LHLRRADPFALPPGGLAVRAAGDPAPHCSGRAGASRHLAPVRLRTCPHGPPYSSFSYSHHRLAPSASSGSASWRPERDLPPQASASPGRLGSCPGGPPSRRCSAGGSPRSWAPRTALRRPAGSNRGPRSAAACPLGRSGDHCRCLRAQPAAPARQRRMTIRAPGRARFPPPGTVTRPRYERTGPRGGGRARRG